ncbi:hypothetical protein BCR32DRAFT_327304 [Anaeromyces robustus]|uniref:Uncharacterized protein n=1 Tax=Anaeromyces robustus TaxID=1754192 RepID=A0A1Y1X705_9FUNG|nr:hypothetical protein BCR32DRAFT_327304 [Anaeromyces robustus]|eukprot:ORX81492.1 hypothetical protein BCR32DRAFT_327304 [Anaeromyces robustus]
MYVNVGKGKYWLVLIISSIAGLIGAIIEHGTLSYICTEGHVRKNPLYSLMINEAFWIINEYSIPYLNLVKMEAFARGKFATITKYSIYGLNIPFMIFRFMIGYVRMKSGELNNDTTDKLHGFAFWVMAIADIICTFCILYFVRKYNKQIVNGSSGINGYVKHSSYTILVIVDVVSLILSIFMIICSYSKEIMPKDLVVPFHCLKNSFVLVLAADALTFKYSVNVNSTNESSGNNGYYGNGKSNSNYNKSSYGNNKSSSNMNINYNTNNSKRNSTLNYTTTTTTTATNKYNINNSSNNNKYTNNKGQYNYTDSYSSSTPFNYMTYDNTELKAIVTDNNTTTNNNNAISYSRSIIKNYTNNIKVPSSPSNTYSPNSTYINSPDSESTYNTQNGKSFGFLNY